jgi:hypothetical protein
MSYSITLDLVVRHRDRTVIEPCRHLTQAGHRTGAERAEDPYRPYTRNSRGRSRVQRSWLPGALVSDEPGQHVTGTRLQHTRQAKFRGGETPLGEVVRADQPEQGGQAGEPDWGAEPHPCGLGPLR